ncbi:ribonuclease HI family protein [Pseudoduganella lutea]|uniref:Ribonuclease HI family protein n=1 Tax=Pseudoduganella lutea TaxID=321985 RepID=A0A4P6L5E8_9BURK|nr:ribonuclease HI family protein [Pseudoduganella lutea]QBE66906.1 ribonuclease HI family protein [Pseudoduganella lutea]
MTAPPFTPRALAQARAAAEKLARRPVPPSPSAWRGWFDGSATPNPGRLGIGALLLGPGGERIEISRRAGEGSSGDAEYLALIALLETAVETGIRELAAYGDSQVVVQDVLMGEVPGAKGLEAHRARVLALMARLDRVAVRWLPRHRNGDADALSQRAIAA